ncbi:MAG TPA: carboxypeptidase-like regulatory domain-containing protein [Acidimicrobiales bacterium]|nr:carboxypeptidase-like regulatory domain-containing protein [Acidimicrobiales bacterium]
MFPILAAVAAGAFAVPLGAGPASAVAAPCVDVLTSRLTVAAPAQAVAGSPVAVTVTAETALGRPDPTFSCTVHLSSSDPKAQLPADHTFTTGPGGDDGTHTFKGVTFATPGSQTVTAVDTTNSAKRGTSGAVAVSPPPPSGLAFTTAPVSGPAGSSPTLGPLTVQFQDAAGNPDPVGSATTVTLSSTSSGATFSAYVAGSGCATQPATTVAVPAGSSTASFCYGDTAAGSPTVSVVSGSLRASQQEAIQADVGAISGTVTDSGSPPQDLSGICVNVQPASGGGAGGSATTGADGTYTVSALAPGSYDVEFSGCGGAGNYATQWYRGASSQASATPVSVATGQTTTGIDAAMAPSAEISGTVTDTSSPPQPLGGICVVASPTSGGGASYSAITDSSGSYTMNGVPGGSYLVDFYAWCGNQGSYVSQWYKGASTQASATPVAVTPGQTTAGIDAAMARGGSISGTVTDTASPPADLAGVCVSANPTQGGAGTGQSSASASDGTYTIKNLAPGSYEVQFTGCQGSGNYVAQWYSGASSPSSATPVPVTAGQTTTGIDAAMAPGGSISGTVTDTASPPKAVAGICVSAVPTQGSGGGGTNTASDGTYTIKNLAAGSYDVEFVSCQSSGNYLTQWYNGASGPSSATAVSVTAGQTTSGIDAALVAGGEITGTVTDTASPPNKLGRICVSASGGGNYGYASTAPDGTYTIANLPSGSYSVEFYNGCGDSGSYLPQWYKGASSQQAAAAVSVTAGQATPGIDAAMVPGGSISGRVTDTASPPNGLSAVCVSASSTAPGGQYGSASTSSDGSYTISGLAPGSYTVEFRNCGPGSYVTQWYQGASSSSSATPVSVSTGQTTSGIDAALAPGGEITGTVTDTASPPDKLGGICVRASGSGSYGYASTAPDGTYTIANLPAGSYSVAFSNGCGDSGSYLPQWYKGASTSSSATQVSVAAGQTTSGIDAAMVPGATIAGTVTDNASPPHALAQICVSATPTAGSGGAPGYATSAPDGSYSITGLAAGSYDVEFYDCGGPRRYLNQWYQGASTQAAATAVTVTSGQTRSGIDAAMVLGGTISGTVTDGSSPPSSLAGICVYAESTQSGGAGGFASTKSDGTYTVSGLPSGTYAVQFTDCAPQPRYLTQWYQGASSSSAATPVSVTDGQTTAGIDAAMVLGGVISGTVTDTSSPAQDLAGMCVSVTPTSGSGRGGFATTASDGTYSVTGLATGSYDVEFYGGCPNRGNYLAQWYQGASTRSSATAVPVTDGQTTAGIDAAMAPGGIISGTVTDTASPANPLSGICVAVVSTSGGGVGGSTTTAADGTYSVNALPTGTYTVQFTTGCPNEGNYAPQWYQGAASQDAATAVSVTAGQATSGIDAALAPGGIISGTVTDSASPPDRLGSICVSATPTSGSATLGPLGEAAYTAFTASDGTYSITRLVAGTYYVRFWNCGPPGTSYAPQWYHDASSQDTATQVSVAAGQTTSGIDAAMAPGGVISGTVTDTASPANPLAGICVIATPTSGGTGVSGGSGYTANDGTYSIANLAAGSYTIEFRNCSPSGGNYASQWYQGASSASSSTPVPIDTGQTVSGIDAAMAPGGVISGTVTDSSSPPNALAGICVAAFPSGSASAGGFSEWRGVSSSDGSYTVPNLPTGSYDVEFSAGCGPSGPYATQWYQGASSQAGATPVPVTAGQTSPGIDAAMTS